MDNRLKRQERESVRNRYATSELLYKVMNGPARELEYEMKQFRFSAEELFVYVLSILDDIKEHPSDALEGVVRNLWYTIYCDLRDLDVTDSPDEEIHLATTEVVFCVLLIVCMCEGSVYRKLELELSQQINQNHPEALKRIQGLFLPSLWLLGEEKVRARIAEYMDSEDEWISDDIVEMIETLSTNNVQQTEDTLSSLTLADGKQTKVLVVLEAMYKTGWFVKTNGSKVTNRDKVLKEILKRAFNLDKVNIQPLLGAAKKRNKTDITEIFDELKATLPIDD